MDSSPTPVWWRGRRPPTDRIAVFLTSVALLAGPALTPDPARAQGNDANLKVTVTDSLGRPLEDAEITIEPLGLTLTTDSVGELILFRMPRGQTSLVVNLFGYSSDSTRVRLVDGLTRNVRFRLATEAIPVEGVNVSVRNADRQLSVLRGFRERRERGTGFFMTREEIEESGTNDLSNLLHMVPGLRVSPSQFGRSQMRSVRTPITRQCDIKAYVDGMEYRNPDDLVGIPVGDIQAIEIYRSRSELPAQFASPDANCGAIVIWTRRFQPDERRPQLRP